uniref:BTB domain-containing protein n=1 Tax=Caenorhabditis tropicalis TaxID=1561998 RepID=A0A1I7UPR3_9PELO
MIVNMCTLSLFSITWTEGSQLDKAGKVHVKILKTSGVFKNHCQNFGDIEFDDVCLVVEGDKFYESKMFLARQSKYFENLLMNPHFAEAQKTKKAAEEGKIPGFVVRDPKIFNVSLKTSMNPMSSMVQLSRHISF